MPEIKNTFIQGKMNKDLDERLIPNGQYRDALNIEVTSADEGNSGTARNILGNTRVDALVGGDNYTCVGSIANELTNKLYWFIHRPGADAVLEYDKVQGTNKIILYDHDNTVPLAENNPLYTAFYGENYDYSKILNFTGKQITGINIVDDFLFWSDGDDEPKKINISRSYHDGYTTLNQAASATGNPFAFVPRLHVNGELTDTILHKDHITVIKKKPTSAPTIKMNLSTSGETSIFEKVFPRFSCRYKYSDGEYSAFGPFTDVAFSAKYPELVNASNSYSTDEPYNKAMVNSISSVELYDFIPSDIPKDVVQVDILYKQEDSNVVYSITNIKNTDSEWTHQGLNENSSHKGKYVITSENIHAALPENQLLRAWDAVPKSALGQEIIGNRLVYANYKQGYNFDETFPTPDINAEYIQRATNFDNGGVKSIKSLRKYQLGYVLGDKYGRETPVFTSDDAGINLDWFSQSLSGNASLSNMFKVSLSNQTPDWAYYYKFYVKSPSAEYYNLLMDKCYFPFTHTEFENKDDHIYVSFPSSDRNKIMEDDYLISKKIYDGSDSQVFQENKYKILDISNEAPDAVKYVFFNLGTAANNDNAFTGTSVVGFGGEDSVLFAGPGHMTSAGLRIDQQTDIIHIHKTSWLSSTFNGAPLVDYNEETETQVENYKGDIYMSWSSGNLSSNRYKVSSIRVSNNNTYILRLTETISEKDARIAALNDTIETLNLDDLGPESSNTQVTMDSGLTLKFERRQKRSEEDFSGKFFVKIKHNAYLTSSSGSSTDSSGSVFPVAQAGIQWLVGVHNSADASEGSGIVNSASASIESTLTTETAVAGIANLTGFATEPSDWDVIKSHIGNRFFIDDMNFIACNVHEDSYAKESGPAWRGLNPPSAYKPFKWMPIDGDESSQSGLDTGYYWRIDSPELSEGGLGFYGSLKSFAPSTTSATFSASPFLTRIINSFEGIVTTTLAHSGQGSFSGGAPNSGERRFNNNTLYCHPNGSTQGLDNTYGPIDSTEKHFIHISFLAPGVNLIDEMSADDLADVTIKGKDSIARKLEGIWGGGAFTKVPSAPVEVGGSYSVNYFGDIGVDGHVIEFEGNYNESGNDQSGTPGPGIGQGYDLDYGLRHSNQWKPQYSDSGTNEELNSFVERIKTPGQKFIFKGDDSETVYRIESVTEKHMYNHTPWRMRWLWDDTNSEWVAGGDSVEEAASAWADFTDVNLTPSNNSGDEGYSTAATALADAITDFGAANNRRVTYIIELDKDPVDHYDPRTDSVESIDATIDDVNGQIQFVSDIVPSQIDAIFSHPTIWETEPQQLADLNIYHEASNNIPIKLTSTTNELFAPVGSKVDIVSYGENYDVDVDFAEGAIVDTESSYISLWNSEDIFEVNPPLPENNYTGSVFRFSKDDGSYVEAKIIDQLGPGVQFKVNTQVDVTRDVGLSWFNCFSFGDGIESNRVRDGYNKMQISNGARVSATLEQPFIEEHRTNGLIYSGIYNSNSGVNNLNQFIAAEKITKDLNPTYGSIQKLFSRNTDLVALCEDRVLKILANKDALFNADGNPQLVATPNVLGQSVPFSGDFGISTHPESFAHESFRAYFTDKQRGAVLRLSMDGLTPISDAGMRDWFRDNLVDEANFIGSYDAFNKQYNLTIKSKPILGSIINDDFSEGVAAVESFNNTEYIDNGAFTQGLSFSGVMQLEDLDLVERNKTINPDLFVDVTIRNHPEILAESLVASVTTTEEVDTGETATSSEDIDFGDPDFEINYIDDPDAPIIMPDSLDGFPEGQAPVMFGFDENLNSSESPFDDVGSTATTFNIKRYNNTEDTNQVPAVLEEYNGYGGDDTNLGFGVGASGGGISGHTNTTRWTNPTTIFHQNESGFAAGGVPSTLDDGNNDDWHAINKGITFRGSPTDEGSGEVPWGYIQFPSNGFIEGGTNQLTDSIINSEPAARNNTIFKGEEIEVTVNYRSNHLGTESDNFIRVELFDGNSPLDSSYFAGGTTFSNENIEGWTNSQSVDTLNVGAQYDSDKLERFYYKFSSTNDTIGDIAVQDLQVRISVFMASALGTNKMWRLSETVITSCEVKKIYMLLDQDYDTGDFEQIIDMETQTVTTTVPIYETVITTTPGVPLETIDPWAEVIFPTTVEGYQQIQSIDYSGIASTFGFQNLAEEISYIDADGNEQTYLSGQGNGTTSYNQYPGQAVESENYTQAIESVDIGLLSFATGPVPLIINLDETKLPLDHTKWYLLEIELPDEIDFSTIGDFELPFIQLLDSSNQPQLVFYNSNNNIQIGDFIDHSTLRLELIDNKLTALFNPGTGDVSGIEKISLSTFSYPNVSIPGAGTVPSLMESIRFTDVSVDWYGGHANNWNISPELRHIERAAIPGTTTIPQSHPSVYYQNGQINFNSSFENVIASTFANERSFTQQLPDLPEVNDHYELVVQYGNDAISGNFNTSEIAGITINVGDYEFTNALGGDLIQVADDDSFSISYYYGPINFDGGPAEIKFTADNLFVGSVKSVSLKDMTNYFEPGSAGSWIIDGFDQGLNNFISWYQGSISFNDALQDHRIYQQIGELPVGQSFKLSFNLAYTTTSIANSGTVKVSYINEAGLVAFERVFGFLDQGLVNHQFLVGEGSGEPLGYSNTFIIEASGSNPLVAIIDNLKLRRVITDEEFGTHPLTISYNEDVKGWVSFKSFVPESGLSLSSQYFTTSQGKLWQHYTNENRNDFYGQQAESRISVVLNNSPSTVKNFNTVNYEGSQAKILNFATVGESTTMRPYNAGGSIDGWEVTSILTNLEEGQVPELIEKENKWFNYIRGLNSLDQDTSSFNFQGIGVLSHTTND